MTVQMVEGGGDACGKHSTGGNWSKEEESSLHINVLEMESAFFAVRNYSATLSEISKHLRVDNTANLAWIKSRIAANKTVHLLLKEFLEFCAEKQIWVYASYISSSRNKVADKESRKLRDNLEWSVKEKLFDRIVPNFGPVITDLFASRVNCKVNRYYSHSFEFNHRKKKTIGIDAFSYCCSNETFYAFLSFAIIPKVLSKIQADMAKRVPFIPPFTTQSWFTRLLRLLIHESLLLRKSNTSFYFPHRRKNANLPKCNLDSMSCVRKLCKDKGISYEIAETIIQSWRPNTICKY